MKFGLFGLHWRHEQPEVVADLAVTAERAGFESLWVGDHVALPASVADPQGIAYRPRLEGVALLSFLAAVTTRIRLGTGVLVLPQRHPVILAKQLTTLDFLSSGRLIAGFGVGYIEAELMALGVSLGERGVRTDEYLAAMRALWAAPIAGFQGHFASFSNVVQRPLPVQRPHPPIVVGGNSPAAYRRAIEQAHGWFGWALDHEQTAAAIRTLERAARQYRRAFDLGELEITVAPPGPINQAAAKRYRDLGVHRLVLKPEAEDVPAAEAIVDEAATTLIGAVS